MSEDIEYVNSMVREKLKKEIRKRLHKDPSDFGPQISFAIQYAKEEFKKQFEKMPAINIEGTILMYSLAFIQRIEKQDEKFVKLTDLIKIYKSFFLIGAGVSFEAELPLSKHMLPIVAGTLELCDSNKNWRQECFDAETGDVRLDCWRKIKENSTLVQTFKEEFRKLVLDKWKERAKMPKKFLTHRLLVKYFLNEKILELICLNWDNLIESEYKLKTGRKIRKIITDGKIKKHSLWKLHGDVEDIDGDWVLPHENGRLFVSLIEHLKPLKTPVFVKMGYSEREINISDQLIAKLQLTHETYTIRPDINPFQAGEYEIACTATYAMKKIDELLRCD